MTEASGLGFRGFCHGIIVGDLDNDGDQDVFLCNYGPNVLYLNNGDGTFKDISKSAGIDVPNWSSGGAMLDYDNDGDLDIYVANYGRWIYPEDHHVVGDLEKKICLYSSPRTIKTVKHLFYRNNGNVTFTDVYDKVITVEKDEVVGQKEEVDPKTRQKKTVDVEVKKRVPSPRSDGHGFGVVAADLNDDGLIDLYVANDMNPNFLFLNRGDGTFDDVSEASGAAYDINGMAQSGMGVDAEDVDGDGLPELFVTNFANEYNTLYQNFGKGVFFDNTAFFGLAVGHDAVRRSWGTALRRLRQRRLARPLRRPTATSTTTAALLGQPVDYEEIPLLFRNHGRQAVPALDHGRRALLRHGATSAGARPSATSTTTATSTSSSTRRTGHAAVLRNDTPTKNHWVRLVLQGTRSNRDADRHPGRGRHAAARTIYRQRKGGVSLESAQRPAAADRGRRRHRMQEDHDPLALGRRDHAGERQGRPDLPGRRAQGRRPAAKPREVRAAAVLGSLRGQEWLRSSLHLARCRGIVQ